MKERLHNLAAAQLGVDPGTQPQPQPLSPAPPEAEAAPVPEPVAELPTPEPEAVVAAEPVQARPPRVMPRAAALGETEIIVTADAPVAAGPGAGALEEQSVHAITDYRAVLVLVAILVLASLMMYAINRSRF